MTSYADQTKIAAAADMNVKTVAKYFRGEPIRPASKTQIELACRKLKLATYDQLAAHNQDPRTHGEE
jgi:hypothetical protein